MTASPKRGWTAATKAGSSPLLPRGEVFRAALSLVLGPWSLVSGQRASRSRPPHLRLSPGAGGRLLLRRAPAGRPRRSRAGRGGRTAGWLATLSCIAAMVAGVATGAGGDAAAQPAAGPAAAATAGSAGGAPEPTPPPGATRSHLTPVPLKWLPPGSGASPVPSDEIFPPQTLTLRFDHRLHVKTLGLKCRGCHRASASSAASDRLLPPPRACDRCHAVSHGPRATRPADKAAPGPCPLCHAGENAGKNGKVAPFVLPPPNLIFNHRKHLVRNIDCAQCHGFVAEVGRATREQLPRMVGCLMCHGLSGAAQGEARGACTTCHLAEASGNLKTLFSQGSLTPPLWLHGAAHTPDWISRHKPVAAANSALCASCHSSGSCSACHDGNIRPRPSHPNDWLAAHPQAARQDSPRCTSCHQLQSFCGGCHRRVGVARDVTSTHRSAGRRFHPTPQIWTVAPRSAQHHSWEAQRNLDACVSCHSERDCATCHATKGLRGGQGVNPHPLGFADRCRLALSRNPRPCLVCHQAADPLLGACR